MGNRGLITLENKWGELHPVGLYLHWNGGIESTYAFVHYTWQTFLRGRDDLYTFQARLCQVIGNYFPEDLSMYGIPVSKADGWDLNNPRAHFRVGPAGVTMPGHNHDWLHKLHQHRYWTNKPNIVDIIRERMPSITPFKTNESHHQ